MSPYLDRRASELAERRINAARVVIINGPRQSGKTSLMHKIQQKLAGTYITLDQPSELSAALDDPTGFIEGLGRPLFIDEIQRGRDPLALAIKAAVDISNERGQFVLAGSTRFLTEPRLSESLAGRVRFVDLWPLSQGEIDDVTEVFVDALFSAPGNLVEADIEPLTRHDVFERVCRGGFPEAVLGENTTDRREFFTDYLSTITTKDIAELADLGHRASIRDMVRLLATRTACELNISDLARELHIPTSTLARYIPLLETIYLHHQIPAWSRNMTARVIKRPKIHFIDSGLAAHVLGVDANALSLPTSAISGPLLESFVAGEIARQLTWSDTDASLYHWRDRDGYEVDLVLESARGSVVGIEVKASVDVKDADFKGLRRLKQLLGAKFEFGIVIHCGTRARRFGNDMASLPVNWLWDRAITRR